MVVIDVGLNFKGHLDYAWNKTKGVSLRSIEYLKTEMQSPGNNGTIYLHRWVWKNNVYYFHEKGKQIHLI